MAKPRGGLTAWFGKGKKVIGLILAHLKRMVNFKRVVDPAPLEVVKENILSVCLVLLH